MESRTCFEDATFRLTLARNVLIASWFDAPEVAQMSEFRRVSVAMQREHPAGTAMINLVLDGTPRFQPGVRDELVKLMREKIHRLGAAHVVLVDGLRGSATRAFLTTGILLGRPRAPSRVFADVDPAAEQMASWLARGAVRWTASDVRGVVAKSREPIAPRRAAPAV